MVGWLRVAALVGLVAAATLPTGAQAHTPETPLPVELEILADEGEDAFYWFDGYDLYNLFVREAYWMPLDQEGLIFRFTLYGGFAPGRLAEALHIDISMTTPAGDKTVRFTTTDDQTWTGDGHVLAVNVTPDSLPWTGVTSKLQVFVPHEALGTKVGDEISNVVMRSFADDQLLDAAPGGWFVPGTSGAAEVPAESVRLVESFTLVGPVGYATVTPTVDADNVTFLVQNPFENDGQHFHLDVTATPGWTFETGPTTAANVKAKASHSFVLRAVPDVSVAAPLPVLIGSDVGGADRFWIGVNASQLVVSQDPGALPVVPLVPRTEAAPGIELLVAGLAALAVALLRRR